MKTNLNRLDRLMMAVAFAEANEPQLARECIDNRKQAQTSRVQPKTERAAGQIMPNQIAR